MNLRAPVIDVEMKLQHDISHYHARLAAKQNCNAAFFGGIGGRGGRCSKRDSSDKLNGIKDEERSY